MAQCIKSRPKDFLPLRASTLTVSRDRLCKADQSWEGGTLESRLLLWVWIPGGWQAATLGPCGYFWKDSRNLFKLDDFTAKDTDKKSFPDLRAGCRRQEWIICRSRDISACPNPLSREALCLESQPRFWAKPWWFICASSVKNTALSPPSSACSFQKEPLCCTRFIQPSLTNLQICSAWRKAF